MRRLARLLAAAALGIAPALATAGDVAVAWLAGATLKTHGSVPSQAPLGSLWKLFVYAYAAHQRLEAPPYRCGVAAMAGEEFCCEPGATVTLDTALARSCGPAFAPRRLGIDAVAWREFWSARMGQDPAWLTNLDRLGPDTEAPVVEILQTLAAFSPEARQAAMQALLPVMTAGYGRDALPELGGSLRVKTFTWSLPATPDRRWGGAAGWRVDGLPVWFAADGASRQVLRDHAATLARVLPPLTKAPADEPCVVVNFFTRYPVAGVDRLPEGLPATEGTLAGRFRVRFENGQALVFESTGDLALATAADRPRITGRLGLTEYVARVVDREADATETQAARALAIVARSWLLSNARFESGCYRVEDSSRAQRVSANPATPRARAVTLFGDGLILAGASPGYRLETTLPGVLSWRHAVQQGRDGARVDAILAEAFPGSALATAHGGGDCRRLPEVERWLARAVPRWHILLGAEAGFEPPAGMPAACALDRGNPYADTARLRLYVRGIRTADERVAVAHEYLHMAFRFHPRGQDERFVERLARQLEAP